MPGRLAELAHFSARIRAGLEKQAGLGAAIGQAVVKNPIKSALTIGGSALAGQAGINKSRTERANFQPAVRDYKTGL